MKTLITLQKGEIEPKRPKGYSVWVENGKWFKAPTVDPNKFGPHNYRGSYYGFGHEMGDCECGCSMQGYSSSGPVDPFGACPSNPRKSKQEASRENAERQDQEQKILEGVLRVQMDNFANMVADPNGEFPACKPKLWTTICERCDRDIRERNGKACPAVPPHQRWSFNRSKQQQTI